MNFKSPWLWGILLLCSVIFYVLYQAVKTSWGKIKEIFSSE
jgi:hypothetical protein